MGGREGGLEGSAADVLEGLDSFAAKTFRTCRITRWCIHDHRCLVRVSISLCDLCTCRGRRVWKDRETATCCVGQRVAPEGRRRAVARVTAR